MYQKYKEMDGKGTQGASITRQITKEESRLPIEQQRRFNVLIKAFNLGMSFNYNNIQGYFLTALFENENFKRPRSNLEWYNNPVQTF